jgi:hypothetical protein
MKILILTATALCAVLSGFAQTAQPSSVIHVKRCADFAVTGRGTDPAWKAASWIDIPVRTNLSVHYGTRVKMLYSETGIYFFFSCQDSLLTTAMDADFRDLWNDDVVEVFLQPDPARAAYLEYELSPLNFELPISIRNENGVLNSWIPFHYGGDRRTRHAVVVEGGEQKPHAAVSGWKAEFFIPFRLMHLLTEPPSRGAHWKTNLYRIDYDHGETLFSWRPTSGNFHEYDRFGDLIFD